MWEAGARYGEIAGKFIVELGGRVVRSTTLDQLMIGPADPPWVIAALRYCPVRVEFMQMLADPDF